MHKLTLTTTALALATGLTFGAPGPALAGGADPQPQDWGQQLEQGDDGSDTILQDLFGIEDSEVLLDPGSGDSWNQIGNGNRTGNESGNGSGNGSGNELGGIGNEFGGIGNDNQVDPEVNVDPDVEVDPQVEDNGNRDGDSDVVDDDSQQDQTDRSDDDTGGLLGGLL